MHVLFSFPVVSWIRRKWLEIIHFIARACVHGTNCQGPGCEVSYTLLPLDMCCPDILFQWKLELHQNIEEHWEFQGISRGL